MSIDHNIVLEVTLLVFADSYLGLSNGNFATVFARDLIRHTSPSSFGIWFFSFLRAYLSVPMGLNAALTSSGVQPSLASHLIL